MSDAQDTIELPVFGLTLTRNRSRRVPEGWYVIGDNYAGTPRVSVAIAPSAFVTMDIPRGGVNVSYSAHGNDVDDACARILAQMTPDDVAAIRALGEQS